MCGSRAQTISPDCSMNEDRRSAGFSRRIPDASLLGHGSPRDPIAGSRFARQHEDELEEVPPRHDEWQIAYDRPRIPAALPGRRQRPQAEDLLADRATA